MSPVVLGVKLPDPAHSEAEVTPQSEQIRQTIREEEQRRQKRDDQLAKRIERIERKVNVQTWSQWIVGSLIALVGIYVSYEAATQQSQVADAAEQKAIAVVDSRLRQHLQTVEQTSLSIAVEAVKIRDAQIAASQNPPPLKTAPDKLAANKQTR